MTTVRRRTTQWLCSDWPLGSPTDPSCRVRDTFPLREYSCLSFAVNRHLLYALDIFILLPTAEKNRPSDGWIVFDHNGCLTLKSLLTAMPVYMINVCFTTRLKHRWCFTAWLRRQNWRRPPETDLKAWFGCYLLTLQCLPRCAFQCTGKYILASIISLQRWHADVVPICQSYFQEVMLKGCLTDIGWRRSFSSTQGCRQTLNRCSRWNLSKLLKLL